MKQNNKNMPKKIAVTGGIGSGKSKVLSILQEKGFPVFSCDEIYKDIIRRPDYVLEIGRIFPKVIENGEINRAYLAQIIFNDEEKRKALNAVAHPFIMRELFERMNGVNSYKVFAEVPLLFEGNFEKLFDDVWVVDRAVETRIEAIAERDGLNRTKIEQRMSAQFPYQTDEGMARIKECGAKIIKNEGSLIALSDKIEKLLDIK